MYIKEIGARVQIGFTWLRTGTSGGLLWTHCKCSNYLKG